MCQIQNNCLFFLPRIKRIWTRPCRPAFTCYRKDTRGPTLISEHGTFSSLPSRFLSLPLFLSLALSLFISPPLFSLLLYPNTDCPPFVSLCEAKAQPFSGCPVSLMFPKSYIPLWVKYLNSLVFVYAKPNHPLYEFVPYPDSFSLWCIQNTEYFLFPTPG